MTVFSECRKPIAVRSRRLLKKFILVLLTFSMMISVGCTRCGVSDLDDEKTEAYLEQRYDRDFKLISSEKSTENEHGALDERMSGADRKNSGKDEDVINVFEDEDGIRFHVYHYHRHGMFGSSWIIADDYCVQLLMAQPEIYEPLEKSGFKCSYFNKIGLGDQTEAGFAITAEKPEDIRKISELAFQAVNSAELLPDIGQSQEEDTYRRAIIPEISIVNDSGIEIISLDFRTKKKWNIRDKEDFIHTAEDIFSKGISGASGESMPLYIGDEKIGRLFRDLAVRGYGLDDSVKVGSDLEFSTLIKLCEHAGFDVSFDEKKLEIKNDLREVKIRRYNGKGYDKSIYKIYLNGSDFYPEGSVDDELQKDICRLTIGDIYNLFGIRISVDYDKKIAYAE